MRVRIGTLNVAGLGGHWFHKRREDLVRGLNELDLDVICLQEVTTCTEPEPYDQAIDLAERLRYPVVFFSPYGNPEEVESRTRGGLTVFCRWPLHYAETLRLPPGVVAPDSRVATMAAFAHPSGDLRIVSTHLSWRVEDAEVRKTQVEHILLRMEELGWVDDRCVVLGDMNAEDQETPIRVLSDRFVDTYRLKNPGDPGHTFSAKNPLVNPQYRNNSRRLDYIFVDRRAAVLDAKLALTPDDSGPVSDHYALIAEVRWSVPVAKPTEERMPRDFDPSKLPAREGGPIEG